MAAAVHVPFTSAVLSILLNRFTDYFENEIWKIKNFREILRKLETSVFEAYNLLSTVDPWQVDNDALQLRVNMVTSLCYEADDLLSEMEYEIVDMKWESASCKNDVVVSVKNLLKPHGIVKLQKKLDDVMRELRNHLDLSQHRSGPSTRHLNRCPLPNQCLRLVGRDEDIQVLIEELTSPEKDSFGVSIVGMKGVGKTALAHKIQNHREVRDKFPLILQASLSAKGEFNSEYIIDQLAKDYQGRRRVVHRHPRSTADVQVGRSISPDELLSSNKSLIVLDNLLDIKHHDWREFRSLCLSYPGSKILITTLNPKVSLVTQTTRHFLKPLPEEHCRELIIEEAKISLADNSRISPIVDTLAQKCNGLPIVANFLGCHWQPTSGDSEQRSIVDMDLPEIPEFRSEILPILSSSYSQLEPHLKKCFAYFSLFPLGHRFEMEDLIQLWIGEGFIERQGNRSLEHVGEGYFQSLLKWSILQPLHDIHDDPSRYEIHIFTHYLAQLAASETCLCLDEDEGGLHINLRHLSFSCQDLRPRIWSEIEKLRGLRTFLPLRRMILRQIPSHLFKRLTWLRVLSLNGTDVIELPDSINKLKFLRYLDVSGTPLTKLPDGISDLYNLRILKLKGSPSLLVLPKKFSYLTNLQYLDWDTSNMRKLASMPSNIGSLTKLRSLPLFMVGDKNGYRITELRHMNYLEKSICITNLEHIRNKAEAEAAKLSSKRFLKRLELEWNSGKNKKLRKDVLTALEPHVSLKELRIRNYSFSEFPQWISRLHKVEAMHLHDCKFCTALPTLGQLRSLKTLRIETMGDLESLDHQFHGSPTVQRFPQLESLVLNHMPKLQHWTRLGPTDMPCLRDLVIVDCPKLISLPSLKHLTSLRNLHINQCGAVDLLPELPTSLTSLIIMKCDLLKDRCQVGASDWSKIRCIPILCIDDGVVPTSDDQSNQGKSIIERLRPYLAGWRWQFLAGLWR